MNLLHDPWIPVRDRSGERHWITPDRLSEPDWAAFDAGRPDFNGALAQFAIGLLQTTTPVNDSIEWRGLFNAPPSQEAMREWFAPQAFAFELDGDKARFMQDMDIGHQDTGPTEISALLIEAPGENTTKNNTDLFIKRNPVRALCPACAATALFALQTNAPSGGAGHRTGVRGGGPLTTLVLAPPDRSLWHHLWLNVREQPVYLAQGGDASLAAPVAMFPWLGSIDTLQKAGGELAPIQVHPAHVYWAMPRRIRLDFDAAASEVCDCCGRQTTKIVRRYVTRNYGLNYKGAWHHPLSPYYETKEGWLPLHPQPDGLGYRHWLAWVLGAKSDKKSQQSAQVVERALALSHRQTGGQLRLWAFGYDMDNMKARCWYESTLPLYALADCDTDAKQVVQSEVARWLASAELAAVYLRGAVKDAWFSDEAKGNFENIDAAFWSSTQESFFARLRELIDTARDAVEYPAVPNREVWRRTLTHAVKRLFDDAFVGTGVIDRQNPRRVAKAHQQLLRNLHGPKLRDLLGLPVDAPVKKGAPRKTTRLKNKEA